MAAEEFLITDEDEWNREYQEAMDFAKSKAKSLQSTHETYATLGRYCWEMSLLCKSQETGRQDFQRRSSQYRDFSTKLLFAIVPPIKKDASKWTDEDRHLAHQLNKTRDTVSEGIRYQTNLLRDQYFENEARKEHGYQVDVPRADLKLEKDERDELIESVHDLKVAAGIAREREAAPEAAADREADKESARQAVQEVKAGTVELMHRAAMACATVVNMMSDGTFGNKTVEKLDSLLKESEDTKNLCSKVIQTAKAWREEAVKAPQPAEGQAEVSEASEEAVAS